MRVTHRVVGLVAAGLFGLASRGQAQEIQFQGSTKGCFYTSSESSCVPSASSSLLFLSYVQSTFDVTSVDGFAGIGAAPGTPNVDNLGSFSLTGSAANYNGSHFLLDVIFTLPTITSSPSVFSAAVKGSVSALANGGVKITFDPSSQVFDFESGQNKGSFLLTVNNVSITPGISPVSLTGDIEVGSLTSTPEPGTTALLATGLVGLIPVVRRHRRKTNEA